MDLATLQKRAARVAVKKAKKKPLEKDVETPVKDYARARGFWVRKFKSRGHRSVPDDVFAKNGRQFYIEFKRPGEPPTEAQELEHAEMRAHGLTVYVVDNVDAGKRIIDEEDAWA